MKSYNEGQRVKVKDLGGGWSDAIYMQALPADQGWAERHAVIRESGNVAGIIDGRLEPIEPFPGGILDWGIANAPLVRDMTNDAAMELMMGVYYFDHKITFNEYGSILVDGLDVAIFPDVTDELRGDRWVEVVGWRCGGNFYTCHERAAAWLLREWFGKIVESYFKTGETER